MAAKILFSEQQRFKQWWLWLILLVVIAVPLYGLTYELQEPEPFSHTETNIGILLSLIVILPIALSFLFMRLQTQITDEGILVKFFPFHLKFHRYNWSEIEAVCVRKYSPLSDFGGWGFRYSLSGSGKAYNVSGNQGIQLIFKNNKKLLIGTKKPEEVNAALKQLGLAEA